MAAYDARLRPLIKSQVYWKNIDAFQLQEDIYNEWVLFAVTDGNFRYQIADRKGEASFGDLVFCPPQTLFAREVIERLSFHFYRLDWRCEAEEPLRHPQAGKVSVRDLNRLKSNYYYLEQASARPLDSSRLLLAGHILCDLWQLCCLEAVTASASRHVEDSDMLEAARLIRQHAYDRLVMKEISSSMGLSPVRFTRRFQAAYGRTPIEYLTSIRLNKAQTLLLETGMTLDEIAGSCGYENGFYLSRIFTKKMNISPSAYRKSHRI